MKIMKAKDVPAQNKFALLVYGQEKSGKTTMVGQGTLRTLVLDLEGGTHVLSDRDNVDIVPIKDYAELRSVAVELKSVVKDYDVIVLDSTTRLQEYCKDYVVKTLVPNRSREVKGRFGAQSDWGDLSNLMTSILTYLYDEFVKTNLCNLVIIGHSDYEYSEVTEKPMRTKLMLQGSRTGSIISSLVDGVLFQTRNINKDTKEVEYLTLLAPAGINVAEVRKPMSKVLTDKEKYVKNCTLQQVFDIMKGV